jgi:hypothetical protein
MIDDVDWRDSSDDCLEYDALWDESEDDFVGIPTWAGGQGCKPVGPPKPQIVYVTEHLLLTIRSGPLRCLHLAHLPGFDHSSA